MTAPHLTAGHAIAGKYTVASLLNFTREVSSYIARDVQGNDVVVKLYDPAIAQRADVMAKLDRTRQVIASLPATHVVHVIDSGYDASTAAPYSVTRQLRHPSLATMVASGALGPDIVAKIMAGVAEALAMAGQYQIHHHGLKPTNIFVADAATGGVQLMDFGVSIVRGASPTHEAYAACAPWWAPEQIQATEHGDAVTDVFAGALVAFYALTGRSYWRSCQQLPPDLKAWQQELMGPRTPASLRANEVGALLNAATDGIFVRCLTVNPTERAQTLDELVAGLQALGGGVGMAQAKTMALPEQYQGSYAPPPNPQDGRPSAVPPGAAAAAYPSGQAQVSAVPGTSSGSGYPPAPAPEGPANPATASATPGLPEFPPEPVKPKNNAMWPIFLVVGALLLLGGGGAGYFVMSSGSDPAPQAQSKPPASAAASAAPDEKTTPTETAKNVEDETKEADPPDADEGDEDGESDTEKGEGGSEPDKPAEEPDTVSVKITCLPACSVIKMAGKKMKLNKDGTFELPPGKHTLVLFRAGYRAKSVTVDLEAGKPHEQKVPLQLARRIKRAPSCGQFLNQCP